MGVVTAAQLRRFMSDPKWSPEQTSVAEELCEEMEAALEAALGATHITPRPFVEAAPVLAKTGLIDTRYPVFSVTSLDGADVGDDPLPSGYFLHDHRLFARLDAPVGSVAGSAGFVAISGLSAWPLVTSSSWGRPASSYSGTVEIAYLAGWGPERALVNAIKRKCAAFMAHRHSDVVIAQGLDGTAPPPPATEEWTPSELANLGRFRRLATGST